MRIIPVILSGGNGSRLWPLSRDNYPKQYLSLFEGQKSLFQETLLRLQNLKTDSTYVVCNEMHRFIVNEQLKEIHQQASIFLEPIGRNTAPALALVAFNVIQKFPDAILCVFPADHMIKNSKKFADLITLSCKYASAGKLVVFGIQPTRPETGFGYIQIDNLNDHEAYPVKKFIEKPDKATAENFLRKGNYLWNSGIFVFQASQYLQELKHYAPDIFDSCQQLMSEAKREGHFISFNKEKFSECPSNSIDYAIMEKTENAVMIPLPYEWSDVGSWTAFWNAHSKDDGGNVIVGDVSYKNVSNSLIYGKDKLITAIGVDNMVIVQTPDALLVTKHEEAPSLKDMVILLKNQERDEASNHRKIHRPWGTFETLIEDSKIPEANFKVKHITVKPGETLSLQYHHHRYEHWVVVQGTAEVTCGEESFILEQNQSTYIPLGAKHRLHNPGKITLEIIEVQFGDYLGEDDIVRLSDNYGRL